jgi:flagellar secretion chaperone FliS
MNPQVARRQYLESRILSSSPHQLVEMLYEGALSNLRHAIHCWESGHAVGVGEALSRVQEFIGELKSSLDLACGGEGARQLNHLYDRMQLTLAKAHLEQRIDLMGNVEVGLFTLLSWWRGLHEPAEPTTVNSYSQFAAAASSQSAQRGGREVLCF